MKKIDLKEIVSPVVTTLYSVFVTGVLVYVAPTGEYGSSFYQAVVVAVSSALVTILWTYVHLCNVKVFRNQNTKVVFDTDKYPVSGVFMIGFLCFVFAKILGVEVFGMVPADIFIFVLGNGFVLGEIGYYRYLYTHNYPPRDDATVRALQESVSEDLLYGGAVEGVESERCKKTNS